jgi:hypothetical protein
LIVINDYLTGPAGPKTLPYGAVERLLSCKRTGILTYFQTKVNKKMLATKAPRREENLTTDYTD